MSDSVADKSGFLRMYMSNHPDTLVAYAKWFGKVTEPITSAEMSGIDSKSMTLTCTLKTGAKKEVHILIEPPLNGYNDVKPRLLEMKAIAQEKLGMIKAPRITSFRLAPDMLPTTILITTIAYLSLAPRNNPSPLFHLARLTHSHISSPLINYTAYIIAGAHVLESLYTFTLCRRHQTGFFVGATYVVSTLLFGFPMWRDFQRRVQTARIESVMKAE